MQNYELAIVISGQLPEDLAKQIAEKVKKTIEDMDGKVITEDFWGRRRLAYKIKGQDHGYYSIFVFSAGPDKVAKIEGELKMIAELIRYLLIKKEEEKIIAAKKIRKEKLEKPEVEPVIEAAEKKEIKTKEEKKVSEKEEKVVEKKEPKKAKEEDKERLEELDKKIDEILND